MAIPPNNGKPRGRNAGFPVDAVEHALQHPLLCALVPTEVGMLAKATGHRFESAEGIDQALFIYCVKGRGWSELSGVRHEIRAGQVLVIPPLSPHLCGADSNHPWTIQWVYLKGANVQPLLAQLGTSKANPIIDVGDDPKLIGLFDEAVCVAEDDHTYTTTTLFNASQTVGRLLALISFRRSQRAARPPEVKERIAECVDFMKQHLGESLQLDRLAAVTNLSATQFGALFRKETGSTPMEYLIRLRMERACHLLEGTTLSVKEIADQVGYRDQAHFCRSFREMYQMPPSEYRETKAG
jgi:AraC family transcriptional regulator, arabinose operon regulatory protein